MAKQTTETGDAPAPPPPPPPPDPASASASNLMPDPAAVAAAVSALTAPEHMPQSVPAASAVAATSAMVMEQVQPLIAASMANANQFPAAAATSVDMQPGMQPVIQQIQQIQQIQPEEMCVAQEGGAEMEMTEVRASECVWRSAWIEAGRLLPMCMPHISIFCSHHSAKQRRVSIPCVPNPLYPVPDVMAVQFRRK